MKNRILFLFSKGVSHIGTRLFTFALSWYILSESGSGMDFSLSLLVNYLPQILLSLFAGHISGKARHPNRLLVLCDAASAAVCCLPLFHLSLASIYVTIFLLSATLSDVFTQIGAMGAEIFDLTWISSSVRLFTMLGWTLFGVGMIVAAFDLALEYQTGRANIKSTALNVLKGFFAANLVTLVPVELYKFCINLQNIFLKDIAANFVGTTEFNLGDVALKVMVQAFGGPAGIVANGIFPLCMLIGLSYSVLKVFFANIKRGGILLIQMAVGTLYLFSVPRGYTDGFNQWCKQIIALCLTAFLQTTLLFLGLLTFNSNMLLGLGVMLAAGEVPRIAQQFGLDSSVKVNMMSVVHATSTAVNMTRSIARAM